MEKKWLRTQISVTDCLNDYAPVDSVWREDSTLLHRIKHIVFDELTTGERNVIILYAETASQAKVARALGVSNATVCLLIKEIRKKIIDKLYQK